MLNETVHKRGDALKYQDKIGYFGSRYVPETLMPALLELEKTQRTL